MIGIPIARVLGVEVRVQLGWILVVALVAVLTVVQVGTVVPTLAAPVQWVLGGAVGIAFFVSAMVHDLAHALTARRRGVEVGSVLVSFFGGTTPGDPASPVAGDDLAIAASGPIVSTIIGAALAVGAITFGSTGTEVGQAAGQIIAVLAALNLLIGLVNLVPAYPLDGGRIIRAIAWRRTDSIARGWSAAARTGRFAGLLVISVGGGVALSGDVGNGAMVALSGWFLVLSSRAIRERLKVDAMIGDLTVDDAMERDPSTVSPTLTLDTIATQLLDGEADTTAVPVVEGGSVIGIVGVKDVRRLRRGAWATTRVGEAMARPPRMPVVGPLDRLPDAVERLHRSGLDGIPVVDGDRLLGVLTRRSVGAAVRSKGGQPPTGPARRR